ncbi:transporter [Chitinophaga horti]|uniref:Transporter n=1 Tax=Chitinophaga horti TaxID=2920382 RepID=A0ABY6JBM6_9BACT|nr:transporter [Chitinophaga horti]UYQ95696.1 transporter [Chitinophaga horti]
MTRILLTTLMMLTGSLSLFAQEMNTDISDETEEVHTVGKGSLQLEGAMLHNNYSGHRHTYIAEGLLRYGLTKRLEVRVMAEQGEHKEHFIDETTQSMYAMAAGFKLNILEESKGLLPAATLVTYLQVPVTYSSAVTAYWSPSILLTFQNELAEHWKLDYHGGIQQEAFSHEWNVPVSASLHYEASEKVDLFGEYYAQFKPGDNPFHNAGAGVAWQAVPRRLQLFFSGGSSIHHHPENYFLKLGAGWKIL